jgi:NAD(P)-dependent dehydrogenase (short-subunit alcohol dehydrogenase family)
MAYSVLFMASEAASYITGQVLYVEGGALLGKAWKMKGT